MNNNSLIIYLLGLVFIFCLSCNQNKEIKTTNAITDSAAIMKEDSLKVETSTVSPNLFTGIGNSSDTVCVFEDKVIPATIWKSLVKGREIVAFKQGDLNGDKSDDAIVIISNEPFSTYLFICNEETQAYSLSKKNDSFIWDGGAGLLPIEIHIDYPYFNVVIDGGAMHRTNQNFTFQFDNGINDWYLVKYKEHNYYMPGDEGAVSETVGKDKNLTTADFGRILFSDTGNKPYKIK